MSASNYGSIDNEQCLPDSLQESPTPQKYLSRKNPKYDDSKKIPKGYNNYEEFLSTQNLLESGDGSNFNDESVSGDLGEAVCRTICDEASQLPSPVISFVNAHKAYFFVATIIVLILISLILLYTGNGQFIAILWYRILCALGMIKCGP
ncbi:hypothetical protein OGAPHI_004851 [Ogataea philodendri]|uniref:Uncharacterized protein n=1 Tax=Ogataea philodendri TaxID=1378263 RepID=A0A9P8P3F2_9ASCO|nr:uncharacterized protein OGAPHI_004851 [Ogataea philodendri]KAH3664137.1 hypothetical protein OGAPHI_004851 [Ogataea philodendri]